MRRRLMVYLGRWLLWLCMLFVSLYVLVRITPGGPCAARAGSLGAHVAASECFHTLALRESPPQQAAAQLGLYVRGDLGTTNLGHPVASTVWSAVPATGLLWLCMFGAVGVVAGLYFFFRTRRVGVRLAGIVALVGLLPGFWLGLIFVYFAAYRWHLFPSTHAQTITVAAVGSRAWLHQLIQQPATVLADMLRHFALPVTVLAVVVGPPQARLMRHARQVLALRPIAATATVMARSLPILIGASTVVESIFQLNGVGYLFVRSLQTEDYATSLAVFMLASMATMTAGLFASAFEMSRSPTSTQQVAAARGG